MDPQFLFAEIWDARVPYNISLSSLVMLVMKSESLDNITDINTHMAIIVMTNSLKCNLIFEMLKEAALPETWTICEKINGELHVVEH